MKRMKLTKPILFLYKFSIVVGFSSLVSFVFIPTILAFFVDQAVVEILFNSFLGVFFGFGIIVLVLPFLFEDRDNISVEKIEADKYRINLKTFDEFNSFVENTARDTGLQYIAVAKHESYNLYIYAKICERASMEVLQIIETDEFTDQILEDSMEEYVENIERFYNQKLNRLAQHTTIMTIVCVNRITKDFRKLVNTCIDQDMRTGRLVAGISFGGRLLFVAKQKGGFAIMKYKKYRENFFETFAPIIKKEEKATQSEDNSIQQNSNL